MSVNYKVGILGGGQLGRMLIQAGIDFNIQFSTLDPDAEAPCANISKFTQGKLTEFQHVLDFGKDCDLITIETENVNVQALKELAERGKKIFPQPAVIEVIQDKRAQKQFYKQQHIPTAHFILTDTAQQVKENKNLLPAVNKLGQEGYDGKGVQILKNEADLHKAFEAPSLLEELVEFEKEIAVIVARNEAGQIATYPAVEMIFHPGANLVEYLFSPAQLTPAIAKQADEIAKEIIYKLNMVGVLAVEMFVTQQGNILVNEIAPRPHNSGHQTIETNATSQYQQHLRAILNLPLGDTTIRFPSAMINLLGEDGFFGEAKYQGLEEVLKLPETYIHLYGKKITKPFRKMGHVTILGTDQKKLNEQVNFVKKTLKIIA